MRVSTAILFLSLAACSTTETVGDEPVERCNVTECFNRHQVRNFEVLDSTTLVLYVGAQRCPFLVEFDGTFCDLTFMPGGTVAFVPTGVRQMEMRICARDRHIGIAETPFNTAVAGATVPGQLPCQIRDVASLTDDQLLELYVENGITAPPPPFGNGQIQVKEDESAGEQDSEESQAPPPTGQPTAAVADPPEP
jgi:hypothetical protein